MDYFVVRGGKKLHGTVTVNTSKNAAVALLMASIINRGTTTLRNVPQIEEIARLTEVLESIGVRITRKGRALTIVPPRRLSLETMDRAAAMRTRSVIFLVAALARYADKYEVPQSGGCRLGTRTVAPHLYALESLGYEIATVKDAYVVTKRATTGSREIILYESGDTVTENALIAAAMSPETTVIRFASANYMVQDLCFYLQKLGVRIDGVGTATLTVRGRKDIACDVTYEVSEDPIEAMFFLAAAIVTRSTLTIARCPIDFLALELEKLRRMGLRCELSPTYAAKNRKTRLTDLTVHPSRLTAPVEKIHPNVYPGLNIDNLPFFVPIAAVARGRTLIHDWVYENRAIYFTEINRLGANVTLMDPHRAIVEGPTALRPTEMMSPPALRPAAIILVAMLAAPGQSILRNVYEINRGYENLTDRLRAVGADVELVRDVC